MLIVPSIGVTRLHNMASTLCFISVALLVAEEVRIHFKKRGMA